MPPLEEATSREEEQLDDDREAVLTRLRVASAGGTRRRGPKRAATEDAVAIAVGARHVDRLAAPDYPLRAVEQETTTLVVPKTTTTTPRGRRPSSASSDGSSTTVAAVVADGHGGQAAARHVVEQFPWPGIFDADANEDADAVALRRAWDATAAEFFDWAKDGEGAVVAAAVVDTARRRCAVLHCGDSRCVVADLDPKAARPVAFATADHALSDALERQALLARGGRFDDAGRVVAGDWRVQVPRALGGRGWRDAGIVPVADVATLDDALFGRPAGRPRRFGLILASDGLWDVLSSDEAALYVRSRRVFRPHEDAATIASHLAARAAALGGADDISVALILLEEEDDA